MNSSKFLQVFSLFLCFFYGLSEIKYIEVKYQMKGNRSAPGTPWPLPQIWSTTEKAYTLYRDTFELIASEEIKSCDIITQALRRYRGLFFNDLKGTASATHKELESLRLEVVTMNCGYPKLGDEESYTIHIPKDGKEARIKSNTVWGALRGLETFSQLIYITEDKKFLINATDIEDWPRFRYRGLLLDTARHFLPMKVLLKNLDAMSYNKLNVFHWHIVDDQSFPLESKIYPNLTQLGAYNERLIYTHEDVKKIIREARYRGIRVIPEIDTPGHTQALGKAFPEVLTTCYGDPDVPFTAIDGKHATAEILNPTINKTYDVLKELFKEVYSVFADEYIHLGMDEVYYACWESNPDIQKFMIDNKMDNTSQLEQYYVEKTLENVRKIGYKYMIWQDPVENGCEAASDTIIHIWKESTENKTWENYVNMVAEKNYSMVLSSCWYLNYISYGEDWTKYYMCDPQNSEVNEEAKNLVIGGEACMWGEFVDGTNLLSRLWPRASAVAERLWSSKDVTNEDDARYRLHEQRCRMLRRKVPTQPILNGYCGDYEWDLDDNGSNTAFMSFSLVSLHVFLVLCNFLNSRENIFIN